MGDSVLSINQLFCLHLIFSYNQTLHNHLRKFFVSLCEFIHYLIIFKFIVVLHGPIFSKRKSGIGRKRKIGYSFQRHKDAISDTEVVDQPPDETTSTETTQPPQKRRVNNQWRAARGIVSCDKMVQQITTERGLLIARTCLSSGT